MTAKQARTEMQTYFDNGKTLDLNQRVRNLKKLKAVLLKNEKRILRALSLDLKKPAFEAYSNEFAFCLKEIDHTLANIRQWARPRSSTLPLVLQPGEAKVYSQPYGKVLIISPWNFPFQLAVVPLIGALAAGNVVLIKPSEHSPETSKTLREIFNENFPSGLIQVIEGDAEIAQELLDLKWDYIFYTGSQRVGKIVMKKAAEHLTPLTLELGGKSPAWIDETANLEVALRRVLWGKFVNAGQICISPDYLLLHQSHKTHLVKTATEIIRSFYGDDPKNSMDFGRIINGQHFQRLKSYLKLGQILVGGDYEESQKYIAPTLIEPHNLNSELLSEEIFGPLLPVIQYAKESEVYEILQRNPDPLAFYLFSHNKKLQEKVVEQIRFGGGVINDTLIHLSSPELPFGGIGSSGIGAYHGQKSFETFSYQKSIVKKWSWPDPSFRYPPYSNKLQLLRKIFR